jgi:hypothetical protein
VTARQTVNGLGRFVRLRRHPHMATVVPVRAGYEAVMTSSSRCAHDACLCTRPYPKQAQAAGFEPLDPNAEYCSRHCAERAGGEPGDGGCLCGHPQCQAGADAGIPPMQ